MDSANTENFTEIVKSIQSKLYKISENIEEIKSSVSDFTSPVALVSNPKTFTNVISRIKQLCSILINARDPELYFYKYTYDKKILVKTKNGKKTLKEYAEVAGLLKEFNSSAYIMYSDCKRYMCGMVLEFRGIDKASRDTIDQEVHTMFLPGKYPARLDWTETRDVFYLKIIPFDLEFYNNMQSRTL